MIPTYSLLTPHDDIVTYRVPYPGTDNEAFVEVGLYSWELSGASAAESFQAALEGHEPRDQTHEGVGLRLKYTPPMHYPKPEVAKDMIESRFDVFSRGGGSGGTTFRLTEASAGELREAARRLVHYTFCYWWALDQTEGFSPGLQRKESCHERQRRLDILETVLEDGMVVFTDGSTQTAPYTLDDCTLFPADEWPTPTERCLGELEETINELRETYPDTVVRDAVRLLDVSHLNPTVEKTDELQQHEEFERALRESTSDASGIGRGIRASLLREFDSMEELCADIRAGSEQLRSISGIGEQKEDAIIDALIASGDWVVEDESD